MTVIVVGVSHRSASFELLDRVAFDDEGARDLLESVVSSNHVAEALVLSTCNRVEVYADVDRFHGAVEDITAMLAKHAGLPVVDFSASAYVHYDERAVHHIFSVASGLDSMVVGEQQITGQVRSALRTAQELGAAGRVMNELGQGALRVGKRVHTETAIDRHGASVVSLALDHAADLLGGLAGRTATLVGAGAMAGLAVAHLQAAGIAELIVVNRTRANAERFLSDATAGKGLPEVRVAELAELSTVIAASDLVVACTGATGTVIGPADLADLAGRGGRRAAKVVVDLALPHDVDPAVGALPEVTLVNLATLGRIPGQHSQAENDAALMVEAETTAFLAVQAALSVEPIVVSLRARADGILEEQVRRLRLKLPQLDDAAAAEVEKAMRRAMSALLHTPTVRMKQFAADPGGEQFAAAVQALFDLDPGAVQALSTPPEGTDD
jgi:glutamyl-tRNA reductase